MFGSSRRTLVLVAAVLPWLALAQEGAPASTIAIGVLAANGPEAAQQRWQGTVDYLSEAVDGCRFALTPLPFNKVEEAVSEQAVAFFLADPGVIAELSNRYPVGCIATFRSLVPGSSGTEFGGVVFRKAGGGAPLGLRQLCGKRVAAVAEHSLGGWLAARRELLADGVDPDRDLAAVSFVGTYGAVVEAVLRGAADAGVVRTGTLERMAAEGSLELSGLEILTSKHLSEGRTPAGFPLLLSTRLYPEWPMAKLPNASDELARKMAIALLAMPADHPAAVQAQGAGWTVARDYRAVDALPDAPSGALRRHRRAGTAGTADEGLFLLYWRHVAAVLAVVLALLGWSLHVSRLNRQLRASEAKMRGIAMHDALTGLPNRKLLADISEKAVANAARHGTLLSVLFLDLDSFKPVNDEFGHAIGDLILQDVAERLRQSIRTGDTAARVGGDEFVILLDNIRGRDGVRRVMSRITHAIGERYYVHGMEISIGCSIGASLFPEDGPEMQDLLRRADLALGAAKAAGKGCGRFFDEIPSRSSV